MIVSDTCANGHQSAFHPLCVLHSWHTQNPQHILSLDKHACFYYKLLTHADRHVLSHQTCFDTCTVSSSSDLDLLPALSLPFTDVKRYTRGHPRMLAFCLEDLSTSSLVLPLNPSILLLSAAECRWFSFIYPSLPVPPLLFSHLAVSLCIWGAANEWMNQVNHLGC